MKKLILALLFIACMSFQASALGPMMMLSGGGFFCDSSTADCCEDFDTADTGDVDANTNFDSETDANNHLDISSNKMRFHASVTGETADARETTCFSSDTEVTIKFILRFEDIVDVDNTSDIVWIVRLRDSDSQVAKLVLRTDADGDIDSYYCARGNSVEETADVTMTGIAADTDYVAYLYYKEDAVNGEVSCKIGGWAEVSTGSDDNSVDDGIAFLGVGASGVTEWGDGATDTYIIFNNLEIYKSDQMP